MLVQARGAAGHRAPEEMDAKMRRPKGGGRRRKRRKNKVKAKIPPPNPLLFAFTTKRSAFFGAVSFLVYRLLSL